MKIAIICLGGYSSKLVASECEDYFDSVDVFDIKNMKLDVASKEVFVYFRNKRLGEYDCIYCRGSYKYSLLLKGVSEAFQGKAYIPIKSGAFDIGHDKFLTLLELQKNGVDIPRTYLAGTIKSAMDILNEVNYPVIIKTPHGTHGKGVMVADSFAAASSVLDALEVFKQPYLIQEFIDTNATDLRAIVVGGKVVGAMRRKALNGELRANIHKGGIGQKIELNYGLEKLAIDSAKAVGAEICGVDILEGHRPKVIEVNLSPGIKGITEVTRKNIAGRIAKYLADKTNEFLEARKRGSYNKIIKEMEGIDNEFLTNLDIKLGKIRLPGSITKLSGLSDNDEVVIKTGNGKIEIKKND